MSHTDLRDKVENALNETRMLVLGAQVLLGFHFQGVFQPGFEQLPPQAQQLKLVGLVLMLLAVGLLLTPGAYHQIVEHGEDSSHVTDFTGRVASLALVPFALGLGIDVYVATTVVLGGELAIAAGLSATICALVFWYGLEWLLRLRTSAPREDYHMRQQTDLATRIKQVLTEARVVLPGVQALLGFQLAAVLTDGFTKLAATSQYVHLASLALIGLSMVCLMAPAAFHRIVERGEDTERLHAFAGAMVLAAMTTLALGLAGDFYVVLEKVLQQQSLAILFAGLAVAFFYGLWFGLTGVLRAKRALTPTHSRRERETSRRVR
jgi:hypothetical protein